MTKPVHARALDILRHRGTRPSRVTLTDGRTCTARNIAWGFDPGDDVAHITNNVSPPGDGGSSVDFFRADEIAAIDDAESGQRLFGADDATDGSAE